MRRLYFIAICSWFAVQAAQAQELNPGSVLYTLRKSTLDATTDQERKQQNEAFKKELTKALEQKKVADLTQDSIPNLGILLAPDRQFTLYTWNWITEDGAFVYDCLIRFKNGKILSLHDQSDHMPTPELQQCQAKNWYGALYYDIITTKSKVQGKYYMLLGWDGNTPTSTRKIIEVMYYDEIREDWFFGKKVFGPPFRDRMRFFLEYSADVVVSVKYHSKSNRIVFDHLVPSNPGLEGIYDFYVPDLSFDAFEFRKDYWYFIQNVDIRGEQTMDNYTTPETEIEIKP
ncbi:hypothetical protein KFE98_00040 [bacterium SCSIO 12741]|nr:hypothetical protein KFE98_00040 [bacterium SCSIO 12741]